MDQKFAVLMAGPRYVEGEGYNTLTQARDDGALVLAYGYYPPPSPPVQIFLQGSCSCCQARLRLTERVLGCFWKRC